MQWAYEKERNEKTLKDLTRDELTWQPAPNGQSIGMIYFSQARWMDQYMHSAMHHTPNLWETQGWHKKFNMPESGPPSLRTAQDMAAFRLPPIKDVEAYWNAAYSEIVKSIEGLNAEELDKVVEYRIIATPMRRSFLMLFSTGQLHMAHLGGEMSYLRDLQRGGLS